MKLYNLTPSQENIYMIIAFNIHKQLCQLPTSLAVNEDIDFSLLEKAVNLELERNDALRIILTTKDGKIKQYFKEEMELKNIPIITFKSKKEEERFFTKEGNKTLKYMKGELFRILFFKTCDGYKGIYLNCSHLIIDAMGINIFYNDLFNIYNALKNNTDLPDPLYSFEEYVKQEEKKDTTKIFERGNIFYKEYFSKNGEPFYAGLDGSRLLNKERKRKNNPNLLSTTTAFSPLYSKANYLKLLISKKDSEKMYKYCADNNIAMEVLLMLGMRTYISAINEKNPKSFLNLMCNKRTNYKEKNMGGCLAQTLQVYTVLEEEKTFKEGIDEINSVRTELFRNIFYPYTVARKMLVDMYKFKPTQGQASLMLSWLPLQLQSNENIKYQMNWYYRKRAFNPLYILTYPNIEGEGIAVSYIYRRKFLHQYEIERFHKNFTNIIIKGIENPNIKIKELLDNIE